MNTGPFHEVVIEQIVRRSFAESVMWLDCPFDRQEYIEREHIVNSELHTARNYCTLEYSRPTAVFDLRGNARWEPKGQVMARIEVGARIIGTCGYQELAWQVGLCDALSPTGWGRPMEPWPEWMPQKEGRYPVFYWQEGEGEFFQNGLTFEDPNRGTLWDREQ